MVFWGAVRRDVTAGRVVVGRTTARWSRQRRVQKNRRPRTDERVTRANMFSLTCVVENQVIAPTSRDCRSEIESALRSFLTHFHFFSSHGRPVTSADAVHLQVFHLRFSPERYVIEAFYAIQGPGIADYPP